MFRTLVGEEGPPEEPTVAEDSQWVDGWVEAGPGNPIYRPQRVRLWAVSIKRTELKPPVREREGPYLSVLVKRAGRVYNG